MKTQAQLIETLEDLVDRNGLYAVTAALELVCHEKAEHFAANWQDDVGAKRWTRAAQAFYQTHKRLAGIQGLPT
jgi:hypothetical protein